MPGKKTMPPLPDTLGESEFDRFTRFAKTILSVPRSKVVPEHVLSKLEAEKRHVDSKITGVRRELAERKSSRHRPSQTDQEM